jgi:type IV pilus assembly protein PilB
MPIELRYHVTDGVPSRVVSRPRIGELLVEARVLTRAQLDHALLLQRDRGRKLGQVLTDLGFVNETQLTQTLSRQLSVPWVSLYHIDFTRQLLNLVPRAVAEQYCVVPIFVRRVRKQGETLYIAMDDPTNETALMKVSEASALPARPMLACPTDIRSAIRVYYGGGSVAPAPAHSRSPLRISPDNATALRSASGDHPDAAPEIEAQEHEIEARQSGKPPPGMVAVTLLDGTTLSLPPASLGDGNSDCQSQPPGTQLTAHDIIAALRALSQGADVSPVLGPNPHWEAMFAALLAMMLKKGIVADWEFVEEFRQMVVTAPRPPT